MLKAGGHSKSTLIIQVTGLHLVLLSTTPRQTNKVDLQVEGSPPTSEVATQALQLPSPHHQLEAVNQERNRNRLTLPSRAKVCRSDQTWNPVVQKLNHLLSQVKLGKRRRPQSHPLAQLPNRANPPEM